MSERLKVTLTGGREEYLDLNTTNAHGLEALIVDGTVGKEWLATERGAGVVRVGAIVAMKVEGKPAVPAKPESDKLNRLDDERRLADKPPIDEHSIERRIH